MITFLLFVIALPILVPLTIVLCYALWYGLLLAIIGIAQLAGVLSRGWRRFFCQNH